MPKGWKGQYDIPKGGILGVDPGRSSGGVGYVANGYARAWKMPATDRDVWELISYIGVRSRLAVLERVGSRPGQGAPSTFKFGASYGELKMALVAVGVRYELVSPSVWQGKLHCRTKGDKNVTKARAQQLWPKLKITHAHADALLLAYYGWEFLCDGLNG